MASWQKISSKTVYQNPYFNVQEHQVIRPSGGQGVYYVIDELGAVSIVALDGQKRIYLIQEEKYIPGKIWTIPAGRIEKKGELPLARAKQELKEETGLTAKKWTALGKFLIAPGRSNGLGYSFLAQDLKPGKQGLEPSEVLKVVKVPFQEAIKMVHLGKIIDTFAIIPIFRTKLHLGL